MGSPPPTSCKLRSPRGQPRERNLRPCGSCPAGGPRVHVEPSEQLGRKAGQRFPSHPPQGHEPIKKIREYYVHSFSKKRGQCLDPCNSSILSLQSIDDFSCWKCWDSPVYLLVWGLILVTGVGSDCLILVIHQQESCRGASHTSFKPSFLPSTMEIRMTAQPIPGDLVRVRERGYEVANAQ